MTNNIRHLRQQKGWSVRDLAEKISETHSVHFTTIAKLERSQQKLTPEWIERFSTVFEVPQQEIVEDSQPVLARRLPIVKLDDAWDWENAAKTAEDFINAPGPDRATFAAYVKQDQFDGFSRMVGFAFVETSFPGLLPNRTYLVHGADRISFCAAFRVDPPRLEPVKVASEHATLILGRDDVKVIGRIMGLFVEL